MSINQPILHMCMPVTKKLKLKLVTPILEFGMAKPSVSCGKNSGISVNTPASEKGADKNQYSVSIGME